MLSRCTVSRDTSFLFTANPARRSSARQGSALRRPIERVRDNISDELLAQKNEKVGLGRSALQTSKQLYCFTLLFSPGIEMGLYGGARL
jgi:hypothetical protein